MVPDGVLCDDILTFDDEVAVTQTLTDKIIVKEMQDDESNTKGKEEKED